MPALSISNDYLLQKNGQCSSNGGLKYQDVGENKSLLRIAIRKSIYQNLFYMAFVSFCAFLSFFFFSLLKSLMILPNYFLLFQDFPLLSYTPLPTLIKITLNSLSKYRNFEFLLFFLVVTLKRINKFQ